MKTKVSKQIIKNNYKNIINIPYANLSNLFYYDIARYYNQGIYGWNWACFELDSNTCIITGYRNTFGVEIDSNYIKEINSKARKILDNFESYYQNKEKLDELKQEFLEHYEDHICK